MLPSAWRDWAAWLLVGKIGATSGMGVRRRCTASLATGAHYLSDKGRSELKLRSSNLRQELTTSGIVQARPEARQVIPLLDDFGAGKV